MSKVKDTYFGGAEKKAGRAIQQAGRESAAVTRELFGETKEQLLPFIQGATGGPSGQRSDEVLALDRQIEQLQQAETSSGGGFVGRAVRGLRSQSLNALIAERDALLAQAPREGGSFAQQQALSGALGPEAQAEAFANFQEDPGTQFLREQGLRLIESGAGVTGGLGGGDRLRELTKFSQGLALQNLGSRFNQLGAVTGTGLTAAQSLAGASGVAASGISQATQAAGAGKAAGITGSAAGLTTACRRGGRWRYWRRTGRNTRRIWSLIWQVYLIHHFEARALPVLPV